MPKYLKKARVVALSKDDTKFPTVGNIRPIAVLPSLMKLFEQVVLTRLQDELNRTQPISKFQNGFKPNRGIFHNISTVGHFLQQAIKQAEQDIRNKIKPKRRNHQFVLFMDLRKAFDSVLRTRLLQKMQLRGISSATIRAVSLCLSETTQQVDDGHFYTNVGVP